MQAPATVQASAAERAPARSWRVAFACAAAALYLPQLLPFALTDLLDHGHCLEIYLRYFVVLIGLLPGLRARIALDLGEPGEEVVLVVVALLVTLTVLSLTALTLRRWRRAGPVLALVVALGSGVMAMGTTAILRA